MLTYNPQPAQTIPHGTNSYLGQSFNDSFPSGISYGILEEKQEDNQMSFICMYRDYEQGIAAASDGYESVPNGNGTYTRKSDHSCKLIFDEDKELLITFCGVLEYRGIRTEGQVRKAIERYQKGTDIVTLFQFLEQELQFLEDSHGRTDILVGYLGMARIPRIGFYEIYTSPNCGIQKQRLLNSKSNVIAAGDYSGIVNGLENIPYSDIHAQAVKTVQQAIQLDTLKPEGYRTVGGEIKSALLKI